MSYKTALRTHTCGELEKKHVGKSATLSGWVHSRRDHGGIIFIDLRDRFGITQVRFAPDQKGTFTVGDSLRSEFVITVKGAVEERPKGMANPKLATGAVEVVAEEVSVLNKSETPPFDIHEQGSTADEDVRLRYRYIDLRNKRMQENLALRSAVVQRAHLWLAKHGFWHVETPIMGRETPEGARDYVVPSRIYPGEFYALAQSPQQYKQLLMVGGIDRYYQVARVFRDEDQRADRVPEHTQLDLEMSFVDREDIMKTVESLMIDVAESTTEKKLASNPFVRLSFDQAMQRYGTDKPDLRFGLELHDVTELTRSAQFAVFAKAESVQVIAAPIAKFSRKQFEDLTATAKSFGAAGLAWIAIRKGSYESPIAKFFSDEELAALAKVAGAKEGDALLFAADDKDAARATLGKLRAHLGHELSLVDRNALAFVWIENYPMFEWNKDEKRIEPAHHMFTQPYREHIKLLDSDKKEDLLKIKANLFDLVCNGFELCSGSLRIWNPDLQRQVMRIIGLPDTEIEEKFGHMLKAFSYGAPPHGGVGLGLDRIVAIFTGERSIRDVIAFPMNARTRDVMTGAPSALSSQQLRDLHIKVDKSKK